MNIFGLFFAVLLQNCKVYSSYLSQRGTCRNYSLIRHIDIFDMADNLFYRISLMSFLVLLIYDISLLEYKENKDNFIGKILKLNK